MKEREDDEEKPVYGFVLKTDFVFDFFFSLSGFLPFIVLSLCGVSFLIL
jgi:hypothetical protein